MSKLKSRAGETLVETLISVLIMVMGFNILAGAIVATAKLNAAVRKLTTLAQEIDAGGGTELGDGETLTVKLDPSGDTVTVKLIRYGEEGKGLYEYHK